MKRKIIQIVWAGVNTRLNSKLVALCDDGTCWVCHLGKWYSLPKIPQPTGTMSASKKHKEIKP
jgi:hypothetical protein